MSTHQTYAARPLKDRAQYATPHRRGVVSCVTQKDRANATDALRLQGFTRLVFFETTGGFYCVEGLKEGEQRTQLPDDQAGEE